MIFVDISIYSHSCKYLIEIQVPYLHRIKITFQKIQSNPIEKSLYCNSRELTGTQIICTSFG